MKKLLLSLMLIICAGVCVSPVLAAPQYYQFQQTGKNVKAYFYDGGGISQVTIQIQGNKVVGFFDGQMWQSVDAPINRNNGGPRISDVTAQQYLARFSHCARLGQVYVYFNM